MKLPQTTGFVNQAGGEVTLAAASPEEQVLAAALVIRHGKSIADISMLHEMLGLTPPPAGRCPDCAGFTAAPDHASTCAPGSAVRIMAIAGGIR